MKRIHCLIYLLAICLLNACRKDGAGPSLVPGSVSIQTDAGKDTLRKEVSVLKDTIVIVGLQAVLNDQPATGDHIVTFRIDSTRMTAFRAKYGSAALLPYDAYFFYRNQVRIPAGASVSDSIQLNLVKQTTLRPDNTYVLPLIIRDVDGNSDAMKEQVLYLVVKTAKIPPTSKANWTVTASSTLGANKASNVLDADDQNTAWASAPGPMPQYLIVDFGSLISFSGVTYRTPNVYYGNWSWVMILTPIRLQSGLPGFQQA
jgi:hypothetical protein